MTDGGRVQAHLEAGLADLQSEAIEIGLLMEDPPRGRWLRESAAGVRGERLGEREHGDSVDVQ